MISSNLSAIYLVSGVLFILALRGLSHQKHQDKAIYLEF